MTDRYSVGPHHCHALASTPNAGWLCPHAIKEFIIPHCAVAFAGNKIARRLSEQGCKVAAWNRDGSKTASLSEAGIAVHHSAADAIAASDILVLMLSDADAIQDVLLSAQQPVALQNKVVLQMGTIGKSLSEHKQWKGLIWNQSQVWTSPQDDHSASGLTDVNQQTQT